MTRSLFTLFAVLMVVVGSGGLATAATGGTVTSNAAGHAVDCSFPISSVDASGANVTISEEPDEVVALAPSAAQVMWAIGAEEKVTGMPVNRYTSYLEGSSNRTNVLNSKLQPITEKVVDLQPDLVLAPNIISNKTVRNLREKGLTVYRFEQAGSIADVTAKTRLTGRLVGQYEAAARVSQRTEATVDAIANATSGRENPKVYYAMGSGYTAGKQTFIGNVIAAAGGDNIADAADIKTYGIISEEVVAKQDPDWIVIPGQRSLRKSPAINSTTAVEQDQILRVNPNYISQPGPRVTRPLTTMAGTFHPDAAGSLEIDPSSVSVPSCTSMTDDTMTTTATTDEETTAAMDGETTVEQSVTVTITAQANMTGPADDTTTEEPGSSGGFGPGFGPVAALIALVSTGLLARRR